jgi:hypothetical protein
MPFPVPTNKKHPPAPAEPNDMMPFLTQKTNDWPCPAVFLECGNSLPLLTGKFISPPVPADGRRDESRRQ